MGQSLAPGSQRLYYIDILRVSVIALLVLFHAGLIFTPFIQFVITNRETSLDLAIVTVALIHPWQMPLLFFLSGMSAYFSLQKRSTGRFVRERVERLLIPFFFGLLFLIPPQVYCDVVSRGKFQGDLIAFYKFYFTVGFQQGYFSWHHLWFILYLFVITLIALPVFRYLSPNRICRVIDKLDHVLSIKGIALIGALPLMVTETLFRAGWPGYFYNLYSDWANVCLFFFVFVYGYLAASDERIRRAIYQSWRPALAVAIPITTVLLLLIKLSGDSLSFTYEDPLYCLYAVASALNTWCWIVGLVGLAYEFTNHPLPFVNQAARLSYPFYILHQTILIVIAFYVIATGLSILAKFILIVVLTYGITLLAVAIVDRVPQLQLFFGIKTGSPAARPTLPRTET